MWHTIAFVAESRRIDVSQLQAFALANQAEYGIVCEGGRTEVCTWHVDDLVRDFRAHLDSAVQVSADGRTVWVHAADGSTVGRFSATFGMDVHRTVTEQLRGEGQCLHCTHEAPTQAQWEEFCHLMMTHHGISVDRGIMRLEPR